jgi:L-ascorbate 6-phosphate lactonase
MATKTASGLATALADIKVPAGSLAVGWLGQAGFVFKSPGGTLLAIDPYLSNSCESLGAGAGFDMKRLVPAPLTPEELLPFHGIAYTHSHQDHVDPETVQPYLKAGGKGPFIAPHDAADLLKKLGASADQIKLTWPNHVEVIGDLTIKATFAIPFDGGDMTHVGYLVDVKDGPRFYFTGDTDYNEILHMSVGPYRPDIMATVINGAFRNLGPREGALLAKAIAPKWVIPCHHDLFGDNSLPDRLLRTNLRLQGIDDSFCPLVQGELKIFTQTDKVERPALTS